MIETRIIQFLSNELDVFVGGEAPSETHEKYVVVKKANGGVSNHIHTAMMTLQSHARSLRDACALNEDVKRAMDRANELTNISHSSLNNDYEFTDTTTKHYRYQAVYDLVYME